jgi:hypothetical protein
LRLVTRQWSKLFTDELIKIFYRTYMLKHLLRFSIVLVTLALSQQSKAQGLPHYSYTPRINPPPMPMVYGNMGNARSANYREGSGSYQLPDGSWHPAKNVVFTGEKFVVKDSTAGKQKLTAKMVRQVEVKQDTFLVMSNLPGGIMAAGEPQFLYSSFNRKGVRVLAQSTGYNKSSYFLGLPNKPLLLLPSGKARFKTTMLAIVKDCPALTEQIADGTLGHDDIVQIMQEFTEWQSRHK